MMKASSSAPTPDPRIAEAALMQAKTGESWLGFAKDSFKISTERQAELDDLVKKVTTKQLDTADEQFDWARRDRARYETQFKPVEDEFLAAARSYDSPAKQAQAAAEATADVRAQTAVAKAASAREAASLGITPGSGRFAGINRAGDVATATAAADAANRARAGVRDKGLALKADAVNLGRGLPSQAAGGISLGLNAGSNAVGLRAGANDSAMKATTIMNAGYGGAMQGYAGQASGLNQLYNSQVQAWDAENRAASANASGMGSFLGGALGLILSDEDKKHDKKPIPEGKALEAVKEMPVEEWTYNEGVADEGTHVGTYAQDFQAATGSGDGKSIAVVDAIGITMKAVQDLDKKIDRVSQAIGIAPPKTAQPKPKLAAKPVQRIAA